MSSGREILLDGVCVIVFIEWEGEEAPVSRELCRPRWQDQTQPRTVTAGRLAPHHLLRWLARTPRLLPPVDAVRTYTRMHMAIAIEIALVSRARRTRKPPLAQSNRTRQHHRRDRA